MMSLRVLSLLLVSARQTTAFVVPSRSFRTFVPPLGPTASNGLSYEDVLIGEGDTVKNGDVVKVHYVGKFEADGTETVFENSRENKVNPGGSPGQPASFLIGAGKVIPGWDQGILGTEEIPPMNVGGKRTLTIPAELAYGSEGRGAIPGNQELVFDVELMSIFSRQIGRWVYLTCVGLVAAVLVGNSIYLTVTGQT